MYARLGSQYAVLFFAGLVLPLLDDFTLSHFRLKCCINTADSRE